MASTMRKGKKVKALYDFVGENEDELSFKVRICIFLCSLTLPILQCTYEWNIDHYLRMKSSQALIEMEECGQGWKSYGSSFWGAEA